MCDGKIYDENIDDMDLMYSLVIMSRSHDESRMKSQHVKAAWENKRRRMHEAPMTANCPGWLTLDKARNAFEVIPERAAVVRRIFDESLAGLGRNAIAKGLNRDGVPPFSSRGRGWHPGTVHKVRHNPAVMGYLPVNGNQRSGISEDQAGYYPQTIPLEDFYRVQAMVEGRRKKGGRRGTRFANLFQHLCFCGVCGKIMTVASRGSSVEKMYACDAHVRGFGCDHATYHKVRWLETAVFNDVFSSVDYSRFDQGQDALTKAKGERVAPVAQLEEKRGRTNLLLEKFGPDSDVEIIAQHVRKLDGEIKALESKLLQADQALIRLRHDSLSLKRRVEIHRELAAGLETAGEEEVYRIRSAINQQRRAAIERLVFFPNRSVQVQLPSEYQQMAAMPGGVRLWAHCL